MTLQGRYVGCLLSTKASWLLWGATISAALSGCANVPMPLSASGPVAIERGGASYIADLEPVARGALLTITRDSAAFANSDGLVAKRVADQFCASRGSRVSPQAFGHYVRGSWQFKGGCA